MQINYLDAVSSVLNMMKQPDSACKNIDMHRTCYTTFFKYLMDNDIPFSMDAALDWLEIKKLEISYEACSQYRNALLRLEHYLLFGDIKSPFCRSEDSFFCRSGMSESFFRLTYELEEYYAASQNPGYYHTYSVAIKKFFRLATSLGITEPEAVTIDTLIEYWNTYCKSCSSSGRRQNAVCAMTALMKYLHRRGDVPECYQLVLFGGNAEILPGMRLPKTGAAFHPSVPLEHKAEEYLDALNDWKYMESSKAVYRNDFTWYFMFLELNRLEHSPETVTLWTDMLPDCPDQAKAGNSISARRSHTIRMFGKYLQGTMESNITAGQKRASDQLPSWSKTILDGFIESRRRDGMANNTLTMCRAAGCSFFKYLEDNGIDHPMSITPDVVKAFHNQDVHSTPESKNAYGSKLRQLLRYMAGQDLVLPTLVFAVSAGCAPHRSIVDVLSDDMVKKIYEYREKASTPIELRDTAMVMLGLRMGIRGADILKLQVNDFDWKNKTVSFIQQKTRKAITLPVPTDVGNSVYKYIMDGRPESAAAGNGYIFIRHQAPYIPLKVTTACRGALKRILAEYGFELSAGQGFHMTRKTFATTGAIFIPYDNYPITMTASQKEIKSWGAAYQTAERIGKNFDCLIYEMLFLPGKSLADRLGIPAFRVFSTFTLNAKILNDFGKTGGWYMTCIFRYPLLYKVVSRVLQRKFHLRYGNIAKEMTDNAPKLNFTYTIKEFQIYSDEFDNSRYKYVGASIGSRNEGRFDFSFMKQPIIYISLGTLLNTSAKFFRKCIEAFQNQSVSVIMSIGNVVKLEQLGKIPDNFFVYPFVPQLEVLQKASLFITHGGMNSVNEALYYGTPMIVIPVGNDQPTVARQIETLHLGKYMKRKDTDAVSLRLTAMEILNNNNYKDTLKKFQMKSQAAGGNMEIARQILAELDKY